MLKRFFSQVYRTSKFSNSIRPLLNFERSLSAWIKAAKDGPSSSRAESLDVESVFSSFEVQTLLLELTGMNLDRIFAERVFDTQERPHFALMTERTYQESLEKMKEEAKRFLQFVPVKEPRTNKTEILSKEPLLEGYDNSKFVFVDITFDATNQNRTVVVRETDGTLRTASPEERDRMNRIYSAQSERPVDEPALFKDPYLKEALDRNDHEYVLDYACYFYEPDDPAFVELSRLVFDRTVEAKKFDLLYSTRHFGPFVFYLIINDNMPPILEYIASTGSLANVARLIRLYKIIHPNWRVAIGSEDDDRKIILDYLKQNQDVLSEWNNLLKLSAAKSNHADSPKEISRRKVERSPKVNLIDKEFLRGSDGPLGDMAKDYGVKLAKSSYDKEEDHMQKTRKISVNMRRKPASSRKKENPAGKS